MARTRIQRPPAAPPPLADLRWPGGSPDLRGLLARMQQLRVAVHAIGQSLARGWRPHLRLRNYLPSAANLSAYIGLRRHDLRPIQSYLATLGLSSLGRCEGHVLATLDAVIHALRQMTGGRVSRARAASVARAMVRDEVLLRRHTNRLFGPPPAGRWTRLMVTMPSEAGADRSFVRELILHGMDCARINCAHDGPAIWRAMIRNIRHAQGEAGRPCRILMDLGGPRLRTGPVMAGSPLLRIRVRRNAQGRVLGPTRFILDATGEPGRPAVRDRAGGDIPARLAVDRPWLDQVRPGDVIRCVDLRGRERRVIAHKRLSRDEQVASTERGAWFGEGTKLELLPSRGLRNASIATTTGAIAAAPLDIVVEQGDALLLTREPVPGEPKRASRSGRLIAPAHISCSEPRIFAALRVGHRVCIDNGRLGTVVSEIDERGAWLHVTHARAGGERLGPGKGLNFPDSELPLPALSESDLADLQFAAKHADIVGFSFVRTADDVEELARELAKRGRPDIGVIAKIETAAAVTNLPEIIVRGAGRLPFGVMIARGDLAVEIGYERLAEIQEEILWLCEAAHVPVVWATQVLEGLVKRGQPSRAEISDAAMAERAECVMLNKGPYLIAALTVLDNVIARMHHHQRKKTAQFRALHW